MNDWLVPRATCPRCDVAIGESHEFCSWAVCSLTGKQLIQCANEELDLNPDFQPFPEHECQPSMWRGFYYGQLLAVTLNRFIRWDAAGPWPTPGNGWVKCTSSDPGASPDVNLSHTMGVWNSDVQDFVLGATLEERVS